MHGVRARQAHDEREDDTLTQSTEPGIDHACFHTAETARTPTICNVCNAPDCEYAFKARPKWARSLSVRGHAKLIGRVDKQSKTKPVDSGKRMTTSNNDEWICSFKN